MRFEDLIAWQKARLLVKEVYALFKDSRDFGFKDQICRASVSVMNNLAEGFEKRTTPEWRNYLFISKASCGEVRSMLYVALDLGYVQKSEFESLKNQCEEVSKIISGLIKSL
ncbi:MAG: four helix bundle protein [Flavobacteriales bacterium]|nr:four helix bundle protein [Flavobacteriales bacterium]